MASGKQRSTDKDKVLRQLSSYRNSRRYCSSGSHGVNMPWASCPGFTFAKHTRAAPPFLSLIPAELPTSAELPASAELSACTELPAGAELSALLCSSTVNRCSSPHSLARCAIQTFCGAARFIFFEPFAVAGPARSSADLAFATFTRPWRAHRNSKDMG